MGYKLYFIFNWNSTHLVHGIAKRLQQGPHVDGIGGLVVGRQYDEVLRKQDEVDYEPLHCIQDVVYDALRQPVSSERLQEIESEYGDPTLWPYVLADRHVVDYDHDVQQRVIANLFDFYADLIEEFEPEVLLTDSLASAPNLIAHRVITKNGGRSVSWKPTRIGDLMGLRNNTYDTFEEIQELFYSLRKAPELLKQYPESHRHAEQYLKDFRAKGVKPTYFTASKEPDFSSQRTLFSLIRGAYIHFKRYNFGYYRDDYTRPSTAEKTLETLRSVYRKRKMSFGDVFDDVKEDDDFLFFPLHLQPEAATMILAPMYIDQIGLIRQLSRSIPLSHKLYVKDHPYMIGKRSLEYYEELSAIPNVVLVDPRESSIDLIRESEMVVTITGTAGLEAAFLDKPVMTFGKTSYNVLSSIIQAGDPDDLGNLLQEGLSSDGHDDDELVQYLTAVFERGFEGHSGFSSDQEWVKERASLLASRITENVFE